MRKITFGIVIAATVFLAASFVLRAPQSATASAPGQASVSVDPSALQATIDVNGLPVLEAASF
jgi:hypothetical protein